MIKKCKTILIFSIFYIIEEEGADKAEKCASVAKVLSWYNEKFTAKQFLDAFKISKYRSRIIRCL